MGESAHVIDIYILQWPKSKHFFFENMILADST